MKILLLILDGLADWPCRELKNRTPLKAARKPNMDFLARNGKIYLMDVVNGKMAPESDQGVLSLFGYDIFKIYTGRGPLEAFGENVRFNKGDVVVRCNFASVYPGSKEIKEFEVVPSSNEIRKVEAIKIKNVFFKRTIGYRGVLIIKKKISPRVTNSHPGYKIVRNFATTAISREISLREKKVVALEKNAKETAEVINEFIRKARKVMKNKTILTRGAGNRLPKLKPMKNWAIIADMPVEKAIGKLSKMKIAKTPRNLKDLASIIGKEIKEKNVYTQIKAPDAFAHKGNAIGKKRAIENIDREVISKIKNLKDAVVIITADHATPCKLKAHSNDPVPVLVYGLGKDNAKEFSEGEARRINKRILGKNLLKMVAKDTKGFK